MLGVPYAAVWGVVAAVTNLIPFFGIIIATAPVVVLSLLATEPLGVFGLSGGWLALAVVGWALVINLLEGNLLEPKIVGTKAKVHPVLVLFAVLAGEYAFGIAGMVFAVPTLSIVQNVFLFFKEKAQQGPSLEASPAPPPAPPEAPA